MLFMCILFGIIVVIYGIIFHSRYLMHKSEQWKFYTFLSSLAVLTLLSVVGLLSTFAPINKNMAMTSSSSTISEVSSSSYVSSSSQRISSYSSSSRRDFTVDSSSKNIDSNTKETGSTTTSARGTWTPTANYTVNEYLNKPNTNIVLRAKVINSFPDYLIQGDNLLEVETEVMGIYEPDAYREYSINGDRLFIRVPSSQDVRVGERKVFTGEITKLEDYGRMGVGAIKISSMRKPADENSPVSAPKKEEPASQSAPTSPAPEPAPVQPSPQPQSPAPIQPSPQPSPNQGLRPFRNCTEARRAGRVNIPASDPQYGPWLDRDKDGFGCDE
ncbi:excalibur calcium-binding domain-containing protein [Streptococcus himalayensis]|uniref:Excalibur calcium-binding domain-containing protein n=1 Tax=Streptococcus himalayensis TaxID=1888195 RepID=A0A917A610_9STRE|nr:excalibur calcium-binding domain-containing protein [Streptococcus himalayensis]GGE25348.1 hypothetical protein GCM10011510_03050 [Streptococcus himalayensis]